MPTVSVAANIDFFQEFQELEVELNQTIYDECESKGINLPHGCLAGSCGSCRVEVLEGSELLKEPSVIEQNTIDALKIELVEKYGESSIEGKKIRLTCRARMIKDGKLTLKAFK